MLIRLTFLSAWLLVERTVVLCPEKDFLIKSVPVVRMFPFTVLYCLNIFNVIATSGGRELTSASSEHPFGKTICRTVCEF